MRNKPDQCAYFTRGYVWPSSPSSNDALLCQFIQIRMRRMPFRRAFVSQGYAQRRGFVVEIACKHYRLRQAVNESAGSDYRRMAGQVRDQQAGAARGGRDEDVPFRHQGVHLAHQQRPRPLSADVFDRRDEARGSEAVGPVAGALPRQLIDAPVARDVVEGGRGLRVQNDSQALGRELRKLYRFEFCAGLPQRVQGFLVYFLPLLAGALIAALSGVLPEFGFDVTDAHLRERAVGVPVERGVADRDVAPVG